jgi:RNA polymerase-interacting CarD/CdnL/TRCF family regulator
MNENQNMDMSALAKLFMQQSEEQKKAQAAQQQASTGAQLGSAGIQAGAALVGGLMQQAAQRQIQQKELEQRGMQQAQQATGESMLKAQQDQQNALSRLMASYRSAI